MTPCEPAISCPLQWIDTRSGLTTGSIAGFVHPGGQKNLPSPSYIEDIALRLVGGSIPPPQVVMTAPFYNMIIASTEVTLDAAASIEGGSLLGVEFLDGNTSVGFVTSPPYRMSLTKTYPGTHSFRAKALAVDGRISFSPPQKVTVAGPSHGGVNLNGDSVVLDGVVLQSQSEAAAAGLMITNGQPFTSSGSSSLYPAADSATSLVLSNQLLRTGTNAATELGFGYPITNGHYDVFLFIVEDQADFSRDMRLLIEGQMVGGGIGSLALGEWHKYGPYRTQVTDGVLNLGLLRDSKGTPKIAGFSIYQATAPQAFADVTLGIGTSNGVAVLTYPPGLPNVKVEAADHPGGTWEELTHPVSNFLEYDVIPVPVDRSKRFFRLRED